MLRKNAEARPTVDEVLADAWLQVDVSHQVDFSDLNPHKVPPTPTTSCEYEVPLGSVALEEERMVVWVEDVPFWVPAHSAVCGPDDSGLGIDVSVPEDDDVLSPGAVLPFQHGLDNSYDSGCGQDNGVSPGAVFLFQLGLDYSDDSGKGEDDSFCHDNGWGV